MLTTADVQGFSVGFRKRSVDDSGKATLIAVEDRSALAVGTVFEIDSNEIANLDRAEGPGYSRLERFRVRCRSSGRVLETHTYAAVEHNEGLIPYDWYLALVLAGAAERGLGATYARRLRTHEAMLDSDHERPSRREALAALRAAGIDDYRSLLGDAVASRR